MTAYPKNPAAIGGINLKISVPNSFLSMYCNRNEKAPISIQAGKIQMSNVNTASGTPPLLYPINVIVWVEEAPGNSGRTKGKYKD